MAFNDLLSTSFLFSVAIIIILIGGIFAYVSYRMSEQDHKISSMVGLISTMAEELQFFRSKLSQGPIQCQQQQQGGLQEQHVTDQRHTIPILDPNNLITGATSLIPVSDDEDETDHESASDESESESTDDSESDNDSESEKSEDEEYDLDEIVDLEEPMQITTIPVDETNHSEINNIKSIHLEEPIELNVFEHSHTLDHELEHEHELEHVEDLLASDLKTISITDLEDTNKKTDYKKMSINRLREVVIEKGIVSDATKLKKNEILKLLGDE